MNLKRKHAAALRQRRPQILFTVLALLLAGCGGGEQQDLAGPRAFLGGVVADEPRAALVGQEILSIGGSAADAAAAAYFAMSVTLPSRAGLGGGGMCVVYDPRLNRVEALDFVAPAAASPGSAAVPASARGIYALQAKHGRLRWEQVVAPAEGLARFGMPVSRALASDIAAGAAVLSRDAEARAIFLRPDGAPLGEGDTLTQNALSSVLAAIRARGPGEFYNGQLTRPFIEAAAAKGASITEADMQAILPSWRPTVLVRYDNLAVHFAPPPAVAGLTEAQIFAMLSPRWRRAPAEERPHLLAEAERRAARDRGRWLAPDLSTTVPVGDLVGSAHLDQLMASHRPDRRTPLASQQAAPEPRAADPAAASFVAVDREGGAVACAVTMHALFGTGRVAAGTGLLLAAAPDGASHGAQGLGPMLAVRSRAGRVVFAGGASGGWAGASALAQVALRTLVDERPLDEAIDAVRIHDPDDADQLLVETGVQARPPGLAQRGYTLTPVPALGHVNAIYCPDGLTEKPEACQFRADRRGFGLAAKG